METNYPKNIPNSSQGRFLLDATMRAIITYTQQLYMMVFNRIFESENEWMNENSE